MKLRILSDLHLERLKDPDKFEIIDDVECDLVVLAGDIDIGVRGIRWAGRTFQRPVAYVLGNHEYYGQEANYFPTRARAAAAKSGVHLLDRDEIRINGTRVLGCTLWSGFQDAHGQGTDPSCIIQASRISDFTQISQGGPPITPVNMIDWHSRDRAWLSAELDPDEPSLVVTHFPPSWSVVNPKYAGGRLDPYFQNHMESLMGQATPMWIYGHNHHCDDKTINRPDGETRLVSNQLGYPNEKTGFVNDFVLGFEMISATH